MNEKLLREGHNCWRISQVDKLALLFDGENYYKALFDVLPKATSSIVIAGWEVDARIGLQNIKSNYPKNLRNYFSKLSKLKGLHVFILSWKPALYLKFDREFFAGLRWWKSTNSKVHYWQDKTPFTFSSYHEKLCLVDGNCSFLGGMDITKRRWDTQRHELNSPERVDGYGSKYRPVHDVQIVLSGKVTKDLGILLEKRMYSKTEEKPKASNSKLWPSTHRPTLLNTRLALARTDPKEGAWEIETFYLEALEKAKEYIFIENQYLSHEGITKILCNKLSRATGPDIIIILPFSYPGFFERSIFIKERNKVMSSLKDCDKYNRLLIVHPAREKEDVKNFIVVHSKLMAIDNKYFTLGSANLNHRSFRVDNELNICLEADSQNEQDFIQDCVSELSAEHLEIDKEQFLDIWKTNKSLKTTIETFQKTNGKTLRALPHVTNTTEEKMFQWLKPFVDIKFILPKNYFNLGIILSLALLVFAAKVIYEL